MTDVTAIAKTAERGTVLVIQVEFEEGAHGLIYATSPDLVSLFVAAPDMDALHEEIPRVIKILVEEQTQRTVEVLPAAPARASMHAPAMWAAVPPHLAARTLGSNSAR